MHDESARSKSLCSPGVQRRSLKLLPLKLAGIYFVVAALWTFVSHFWLETLAPRSAVLSHLQSIEDLLFAGITAEMLYWLARRSLHTLQQSETTLRESEERLRLMLQTMPVMLNAFDRQGNIIIWNEECERVTGYSAAEIIGNPQAMTLLYPDVTYRQQMTTDWAEQGNDYRNWEWDLVCKDGSERTIAWSNISDRVPIPGWMSWGIGVDVTDHKRSETSLRESEARFRLVTETIQEVFWLCSADKTQVFYVSPAYEQLWGRSCDSIYQNPRSVLDTIHPADREHVAVNLAHDQLDVHQFEYRIIKPDGAIRWIINRSFPIRDTAGQIYRTAGVSRDITEQKEAETALRDITELVEARQTLAAHTTQLEIVNRELESFSYSVSHDLRAPLRRINGFVAALSERLDQNGHLTDSTVIHYLQILQNSSQAMGQLIDGLLTLSRVGRQQIAQNPVDLHQLVATVLSQQPEGVHSTSTAAIASTEPSVQFCVGELPTVIGDAILLQQVFANLVDNAVKFSRDRHPAHIEIGSLADDTIFVRDDGVGFQMEYADQLFGAFQRLHSRSEFEGSGIGLAIVQRIIHRHSGHIWADSQPNQGATFYFKLGDRPFSPGSASRA